VETTANPRKGMLPSRFVVSSAAFLVAARSVQLLANWLVPVLYEAKGDAKSSSHKAKKLYLVVAAIVALYSTKYAYEQNFFDKDGIDLHINHYNVLGIGRHTKPRSIINAFKKLRVPLDAERMHNHAAQERYVDLKYSYDTLLDESSRDVYNLFGPGYDDEDPRNNELSLVCGLMAIYFYFGFCATMVTSTRATRASRMWSMILIVTILILDVLLRVVPNVIEIPTCLPYSMTEHELMLVIYSIIPLAITLLAVVADWLFVDMNLTTVQAVEEVMESKRAMGNLLEKYKEMVLSVASPNTSKVDAVVAVEDVDSVTRGLADKMEESGDAVDTLVQRLREANSNPFSSYYWIIFIVLYGVMYLFQ
jgi:hypothetical protein